MKLDPAYSPMTALRASPLALLAEVVSTTSFVEHVSCSRAVGEAPRWYMQATLRDLRRFEEIAPSVVELGFERRRGKYWHEGTMVQPSGNNRWMAVMPGIGRNSR